MHEVSKSTVGMFAVSRESKVLHGAGHRPMDIRLIHDSRIVDEDFCIDWAIREEAQILLFHFHLSL